MNKTRLLHIGYPKCMSTTLQKDLFSKHPEIMFLGWGCASSEHGWVSDEIAALCEVGIRYEKVLDYDERSAKRIFDKYISNFEQNSSKKALCLSFESFSFTMHFDVDPTIKASRLKQLLGKDTKVLIVIRNQLDLIRSYYYECVRDGYPGDFISFLDFNFHYQFHSIISDLNYYKLYKHYIEIFGKENIMLVPMEMFIARQQEVIDSICDFAGVSKAEFKLSRHNDSSNLRFLQAVRLLNEKFPNNCGQTMFSWIDGEKLGAYWRHHLGIEETPAAASNNYATKMMVIRSAQSTVIDFMEDLKANYPALWVNRLTALYSDDNSRLAELSGLDLSGLNYV